MLPKKRSHVPHMCMLSCCGKSPSLNAFKQECHVQKILALVKAVLKDAEEALSCVRIEFVHCSCSVVDDKLGIVS